MVELGLASDLNKSRGRGVSMDEHDEFWRSRRGASGRSLVVG